MKRLLLVFAVLALTMSLVGAVDLKKTVEGQNVLDFGERLKITIAVDTGDQVLKLNHLTDPVPEGFTASMETSSSCSQSESTVACSFGAGAVNGTYAVSYNLVAVTPVEKVLIRKATLSYTDPQSPAFQLTKQSNPISGEYTVGPPMINLTRAVSVDGKPVRELEVLPNSAIRLDFRLQNTGAIDAEEVKFSVKPPADWSLSKAPETGFILGAGESRLVSAELSGPQADKFQSGATSEISATVSWSGGNRTYNPVESRISLKQVRPEVAADRSAKVDWKLNGKTLEPRFSASIDIRNTGTSKAIVSVGQDPPQGLLGDVTLEPKGSWSNIELAAGESKRLTLSGAVADKSTQKLTLPAATVTYTDSKGNLYPYTAPEYLKFPLELKVSKGLFEIIFDATSGIYPWGQLVAALLIVISAWGLKTYGKENEHLTLAFGAIGIVALLVIVSAIKVILL